MGVPTRSIGQTEGHGHIIDVVLVSGEKGEGVGIGLQYPPNPAAYPTGASLTAILDPTEARLLAWLLERCADQIDGGVEKLDK